VMLVMPSHHLAYDVKLCHRRLYRTSPILCGNDDMQFIPRNC